MFLLSKLSRDIEGQEARVLNDRHLIARRTGALKSSAMRKLRSPFAFAAAAGLGFAVGLVRHRRRRPVPAGRARLGPVMREVWHTMDRITRLLAGSALAPLFWGKIGAALASRPAAQQEQSQHYGA